MRIRNILFGTLGFTLVAISVIQLYRIHEAFGFIAPEGFLVFVLLPILIIGATYIQKRVSGRKLISMFGLAAVIAILIFNIILSIALEPWIAVRPVHDVRKYEEILNKWKHSSPEIVNHFPASIPLDAKEVDFYYRPGFLQSSSEIQLRFKSTPEQITEYYERFSKIKTKSYHGRTLVHFEPHKQDGHIIELGEDFETLQFDEPEHGEREHGVIISKEKNEIIFWAEW